MLDSSKTIYGPFDLYIEDGIEGSEAYSIKGLQNDAITINETVDKEELEDGVERNLQRVLEINASFSEIDESDISSIQGYGEGNDNDLVIQFLNTGREIRVEDGSSNYIVYTAELDDSNLSITAQKSSTDVGSANFTTISTLTTY